MPLTEKREQELIHEVEVFFERYINNILTCEGLIDEIELESEEEFTGEEKEFIRSIYVHNLVLDVLY